MRTASPDLGCSGECFTVGGLESAANNAVWPIQSATKLPHRSRIAERISTDKRRFKAQGGCGDAPETRFILAVPWPWRHAATNDGSTCESACVLEQCGATTAWRMRTISGA